MPVSPLCARTDFKLGKSQARRMVSFLKFLNPKTRTKNTSGHNKKELNKKQPSTLTPLNRTKPRTLNPKALNLGPDFVSGYAPNLCIAFKILFWFAAYDISILNWWVFGLKSNMDSVSGVSWCEGLGGAGGPRVQCLAFRVQGSGFRA